MKVLLTGVACFGIALALLALWLCVEARNLFGGGE